MPMVPLTVWLASCVSLTVTPAPSPKTGKAPSLMVTATVEADNKLSPSLSVAMTGTVKVIASVLLVKYGELAISR
ncbi:hypothetical protein GCM10007086_24420 [Photobacterium aphoticum]|nr:hypothetical protein GCM10007086_24420 [Photobacterium aphoticum]